MKAAREGRLEQARSWDLAISLTALAEVEGHDGAVAEGEVGVEGMAVEAVEVADEREAQWARGTQFRVLGFGV